jgi:replication factor C large subunit
MPEKPDIPWFEKYRPKTAKDMVGFENNIDQIHTFLENFKQKISNGTLGPNERAVLLEGPPGIGKTTVVYAIANDLGYNVVETNASDARTEAAIQKKLSQTVNSANLMSFMKPQKAEDSRDPKKIILIDEVDGISGQSDRGGLAALIKIIEKSHVPIIMTCNFYDTKFKALYDVSLKVKCGVLRGPSIIKILTRIAKAEKLNITEDIIKKITENSGGDLRSAINDLQGLSQGGSSIKISDVDGIDMHRDIQEKIYDFIMSMFKEKTVQGARDIASNTDLDYNIMHRVIFSNLPSFVQNLKDMARALTSLADADSLMGKIRSEMDYSMLPYYFDLVSAGVVFSVDSPNLFGFKKFMFPSLSSSRMKFAEEPIAEELQKRFNQSKHDVMMNIMTYIDDLIKNSPKTEESAIIERLANEFRVEPRELKKFLT